MKEAPAIAPPTPLLLLRSFHRTGSLEHAPDAGLAHDVEELTVGDRFGRLHLTPRYQRQVTGFDVGAVACCLLAHQA